MFHSLSVLVIDIKGKERKKGTLPPLYNNRSELRHLLPMFIPSCICYDPKKMKTLDCKIFFAYFSVHLLKHASPIHLCKGSQNTIRSGYSQWAPRASLSVLRNGKDAGVHSQPQSHHGNEWRLGSWAAETQVS